MNSLFFELIRVAIGTQDSLSRLPSEAEWEELFDMAMKQSLVGVCFVGLSRLGVDSDDGYIRIGMSEPLYLNWMGVTTQLMMRNETVNHQCAVIQEKLAEDGFNSCILKGQGVASLYGEDIQLMRQCGDIDVWVDASKDAVVEWAMKYGISMCPDYLHVDCHLFDSTEVELHYRPTYMHSLRHNARLQRFCKEHKCDWEKRGDLTVPSWDFNVVYLLSHIYRHLFGLGIGLRQLMDYFFVLRSTSDNSRFENQEMLNRLNYFGLMRFAGAVMWVMYEVFHLEEQYLICPVDVKRGRMLLSQVMQTGNFGHMDEDQKDARSTISGSLKYKARQWMKLIRLYPEETLCAPTWSIYRKLGR